MKSTDILIATLIVWDEPQNEDDYLKMAKMVKSLKSAFDKLELEQSEILEAEFTDGDIPSKPNLTVLPVKAKKCVECTGTSIDEYWPPNASDDDLDL